MVRFAMTLALALVAAPGGASGERGANPVSPAGTAVPGTAASTASTASGVRSSHEAAVQDDYPQALAQARRRGLPLLVEVWAPW